MIDEPDGTQGRKTDFHCQHCGPLQDRLASLQVELGRLRQEFRRGQIIAQVIGELHRLANRQAAIGRCV